MNENIENVTQNDGFTLKDLLNYLKRSLPSLIICVLVACIIVSIVGLALSVSSQDKSSVMGVYSVSSDGIDKGLNPLGGSYNPNEAKSLNNVTQALNNLNLSDEFDAVDIMNAITVTGIIPESYTKIVEELLKKDNFTAEQVAALQYHPTEFVITLDAKMVSGLKANTAVKIVDELMAVYIAWYQNKYINFAPLSTMFVSETEIKMHEFVNVFFMMDAALNSASSLAANYAKSAPNFISSSNQTFLSLMQSIELCARQLDTLRAFVVNNNIARNNEEMKNYLEYKANELDNAINAKKESLTAIKGFLSEYKNQYPNITVNGTQNTIEFPQSEAFDKMFLEQQTIQSEIEALSIEKAHLENWKSKIPTDGSQQSSDKDIKAVEDKLIAQALSISETFRDANNVISEYLHSGAPNNFIGVKTAATTAVNPADVPWAKMFIIGILCGIVLGFILTPFFDKLKIYVISKRKPVASAAAAGADDSGSVGGDDKK